MLFYFIFGLPSYLKTSTKEFPAAFLRQEWPKASQKAVQPWEKVPLEIITWATPQIHSSKMTKSLNFDWQVCCKGQNISLLA